MSHITIDELALWQRGGFEFQLLDVRRAKVRSADGADIPGARWLDPALWLDWKDGIGNSRPVVLYCAHGHEISQGLSAALRAMDIDARTLDGGFSAWKAAAQPVVAPLGAAKESP
jgi:rhodanese-related sulfurtransferase